MGLKACCYCVDLRKGSLISGYLILIYHVVMLALQISTMTAIYWMTHDEISRRYMFFFISSIAYTITVLLFLIFTIVLLVGLHKNKSGAVLTFIVSTAILLVLDMSIFSVGVFESYWMYNFAEWCRVSLHFLFACLYVYFLCVFGSYYKKMREGQDGENSKSYYV